MTPDKFLVISDRPSDSPFVERVWRSHSERAGTLLSVASPHCEMVVTSHAGNTRLTLRGPETRATTIEYPAGAEWFGIRLAPGSFMTRHPASTLIDRNDVDLPSASSRSFWLEGSAWEYPDFENAETFVARLVRSGLLARDAAVAAALRGEVQSLSRRSTQRQMMSSVSPCTRLGWGCVLRAGDRVEASQHHAPHARRGDREWSRGKRSLGVCS